MTPTSIPMFRFGVGSAPLGLISGLLIFDSGEAENTFLFRCQDRFLTYNTLCGIRSILFVGNEAHRDRYQELLAAHARRLRTISARIGIDLPQIPKPLFLPFDVDRLELVDASWFEAQLRDPEIKACLEDPILLLNQVSPTCARLVTQIERLLNRHGFSLGMDLTDLLELGDQALRWHDKAEYVKLTEESGVGLPPHVRTVLLDPREFVSIEMWSQLVAVFRNRVHGSIPAAFYAKSSFDSGGNVAARLTRETFAASMALLRAQIESQVLCQRVNWEEQLCGLRADIALASSLRQFTWSDERLADFLDRQRERRKGIRILLQEAIETTSMGEWEFEGIGITCVAGGDAAGPIFASGQLYRDHDRHHFLGSYVDDDISARILSPSASGEIKQLCSLFSRQGYRGPLGFDARRSVENQWVFLYDCNPRLSAVYPALALRYALRSLGYDARSVISLGYRGEWACDNVADLMESLDATGALYRQDSPRGAVPLPNLARDGGCDLLLVNITPTEAGHLLRNQSFLAAPAGRPRTLF